MRGRERAGRIGARAVPTIPAFTIASYAASGILAACFVLAAVATWTNVSAQLTQGVPVAGNELAIANAVLSGCASYAAFAFLAFAAGTVYRGFGRYSAAGGDSSGGSVGDDVSAGELGDPETDEDAFWDEDTQEAESPQDSGTQSTGTPRASNDLSGQERDPQDKKDTEGRKNTGDDDTSVYCADLNRLFAVRQTVSLDQALRSVYTR
ncbi:MULTISPECIES: hypothetical protein [Gordonibacter]|uniref:Uncharacterized protein n=1 Tax=Gordonibacter urolithinfaciens TaxID=1335613 RepID=A0A423UGS4_9ACTN|nr:MULTISPECIES: hypothetical protein [Gordonibacter]MDN4510682.1 hypothetical protein [Gordonibacter sp. RACS_AR49]ROT87918.1 hypothetical protein DMP12_14065 [Gordonibacter urolithinfaciens]HJF62360.1 hypothetical protein [Gordonibacter urolithinfaciens]